MSNPRIIEPMKINRIPDGKESLFPSICASGEYFAELKKDGYWYMFEKDTEGNMYLWSRNVSKVTGILTEKSANVPEIIIALEGVPNDTIIIGEIYYPGKRSKDVTPIMGALPELAVERQQGEYGYLHYYVHDILFYDGHDLTKMRADVRYEILKRVYYKYSFQAVMENGVPLVELAERVDDNIQEAVAAALQAGEEGMVLKKRTAPYTPGKRPVWDTIKIKKTDTCDAIIIGTSPATKYYDGKLDVKENCQGRDASEWPYWIIERTSDIWTQNIKWEDWEKEPVGNPRVIKGINYRTMPVTKAYYNGWDTAIEIGAYDDKGNIVSIGSVSSGLSDNDRMHLRTYIGHVAELAGMEKDREAHTLRHFHFKRIRDDKDAKECTLASIFG